MPYAREAVSGGILRAITPSDSVLVRNCKAIWSNAGGGVTLQWPNPKQPGGVEPPVSITLPAGTAVPLEGPFYVRTATTAAVLGFFEPSY